MKQAAVVAAVEAVVVSVSLLFFQLLNVVRPLLRVHALQQVSLLVG